MEVFEKSQTVDPEVRAYVYSLVNAVGGSSTYDDTYSVGDDAVAALNDVVRWLKLYDEKLHRYDVKRCLAEANFVKGDLLEIMALWSEDKTDSRLKAKLALACLQLLVPLSWPMELDEEKFTINNHRHLPYLQLAQVGYKRAILHFEQAPILRTAVRVALPAIAQPRRERSRRDEGIIKMVLYLFRNVTIITQPQHLPSQGDENEITRSATIDSFHQQDVFRLLLTIGSSAADEFQEQDVVLLEILFHLLKGIDAKKLFMEQDQMAKEETNELEMLMEKEKAMLNGYKKHAPTRHNRFGTMIWLKRDDKMSTVSGQNNITDDSATLRDMDSSKKWNKPKYRGKQSNEPTELADFGARVDLTETARKNLRGFVEDFLDSSFNPLFSSLRKAIERELPRTSDIHRRQYFYMAHWFLSAESARREASSKGVNTTQAGAEDNSYAYIAAVLDQETFVLLNRSLQRYYDEKSWHDLRAALLFFTQILLTVQSMAESKDEEDQEIAENIQSRIFYEEATHDLIVQILRGYANQGFAYLDTITECVHVFVRMLERYSKQNVDLQIRSKRRARKKKRSQISDEPQRAENEADENAEDEREAYMAVSERKFDFARFSSKFLAQGCVDTFVSLINFYQELTAAQLKRCHRYFYRLAFKHELAVYLFRVDVLQLFHRMIKGPNGLTANTEGYRDWEQLIQQVFRRCIKWIERESEQDTWKGIAIVEMLFSKIPNTMFYLQNGYDHVVEKRAPRPPAELQIKASIEDEKRVGVVVSLMIDKHKADAVNWIKKELQRAIGERELWQSEQDLRTASEQIAEDGAESETPAVSADPPSITIAPDTDERKQNMFKDKYLRLLLTTLGLERLGAPEDLDASWVLPSFITLADLRKTLEQLNQAEFDPLTFEDGKSAEDMVRNKATGRVGATFSDDESDDGGNGSGGEINESLFPPNLKEKRAEGAERPPKKRRLVPRNRKELTDEEAAQRAKERQRKEQERNGKIKSALYITAEDELSDDEADEEFFRLEEERRKKTAGIIRSTLLKEAEKDDKEGKSKKSKKRKSDVGKTSTKKKQKQTVESDDDDDLGIGAMLSDDESVSNAPSEMDVVEEEDEEEEARSSRSSSPVDKADEPSLPLNDVSVNARSSVAVPSDDEDDAPITKPVARRNLRAGFILDSDSDE